MKPSAKAVVLGIVVLLCSLFATTIWAQQTLVTFDDLPDPGTNTLVIPVGYNGLNWVSFRYMDPLQRYDIHPNGYQAGTVSPNYVAYDSGGSSASITNGVPLNLMSAYLTAAWNDDLQMAVMGYIGTSLAYSNTYTLSATAPTLIYFNYLGVDDVHFDSFGGTKHAGYGNTDEQFAMDNMTIAIPEPSSLLLTSLGLVMLWTIGRRRRR